MSSRPVASPSAVKKKKKPVLKRMPADDVQQFRLRLQEFLDTTDEKGRRLGTCKWGVYAFYDYEGEPIYVGQTKEALGYRVRRHLTNQRTDAVAMRVLDPIEVASVQVWPLWHLQDTSAGNKEASRYLDACEFTAYVQAIAASKFKAILNEKIPKAHPSVDLPASVKQKLTTEIHEIEHGHPDIRIGRRAETLSRLTAVARERGEVTAGLRRVIVIQAVRLAYLGAQRLAYAEGREAPSPLSIDMHNLIGSVYVESDAEEPEDAGDPEED